MTGRDPFPPPPDPLFDALEAHKRRFGDGPTVFDIPAAQRDALAGLLRAAVRDGRELRDAEARAALGLHPPDPAMEF